MERQTSLYSPRGPPSKPTGVPEQKKRQPTAEQIQPSAAQGPSATAGGGTPQPTVVQTPQTTTKGTPPGDQRQSENKRSKKARAPAVTANVQTTAGSSKR
jgi:hypothetical protein